MYRVTPCQVSKLYLYHTQSLRNFKLKICNKKSFKKRPVHAELLPFTCSDCSLLLTAACTLGKMVFSLAEERKYFFTVSTYTSRSLAGNFSPLTAARAALPFPVCVCSQICMSKQRYSCQCLGFFKLAPILMHAVAHRGCTDTVRESTLEVDRGEKSFAAPCTQNPISMATRLFSRMFYQLPTN